jgi:hypothetical protein
MYRLEKNTNESASDIETLQIQIETVECGMRELKTTVEK